MNILLISPIYPPQVGGGATYFSLLVKDANQCTDIEKTVVLTSFAFSDPIISKDSKTTIIRLLPFGFETRRWLKKPITIVGFALELLIVLLIVRLFQIDLLHYHCRRTYLAITVLSKLGLLGGISVVADTRDMSKRLPPESTYDKILCPSRNIERMLNAIGVPKRKIVYIPMPLEKPTRARKSVIQQRLSPYNLPQKYLLFLGDINENKGIRELIKAFKAIKNNGFDLSLVLAGTARERSILNGTEDIGNIHYLGPVPYAVALALMQEAEMVILPSKSEGLPRVCLEAIALRKKVVCPPNVSELEECCPQFVLDEITAECIKSKIIEVLAKDDIPEYPFGLHSREYTWNRLWQLYKEVLKQNRC